MQDLFGNETMRTIPMMPDEYKGKEGKGCGYTKSKPREWTDEEIAWIQKMRADGVQYRRRWSQRRVRP